jgi:cytochrome c peroxidase
MRARLIHLVAILLTVAAGPLAAQGGPPPAPPFAPLPAVPPVPAANPQTAAKVALGTALFWDEQLSKTGTVACGTCHVPRAGGSDPRAPLPGFASTHPGADQTYATADDIVGAAGVPRHDADGQYLGAPLFGMGPQVGTRQAQSMINSGFAPLLFWDGRASPVFVDPDNQATLIPQGGALENQALGPLVNAVEMAHAGGTLADMTARIGTASPLKLAAAVPPALAVWIAGRDYPALFGEVFGTPDVSAARVAFALAAYQRSLVSNQTPHDQQLAGVPGAMTQDELAGRQAYVQAGCARCHGGGQLTDNAFHYIGVRPPTADPGRLGVTGQQADRGRMRTPGLRNVELTAPYMADGRFDTLEEVVDFYNRGGDFAAPNKDPRIVPLNLTPQQRAAIASFLRRPLTDARVRDETGPFARPTLYSESGDVPQPVRAGTPGSGGITPRLIAVEPPLAGSSDFTIGVDQAPAGAAVRVLLDVADPVAAGDPAYMVREATLSAQGMLSLDLTLPDGEAWAGQPLYLRVFVADPNASDGWSATRTVRFNLLGVQAWLFASGFEP